MIYVYALGCLLPLIAILWHRRLLPALPLMIALFWALASGFVGIGGFLGMGADSALGEAQFKYLLNLSIMMFAAWVLYTWITALGAHLKQIVPIVAVTICHFIVAIQACAFLFPGSFAILSYTADGAAPSPRSLRVVLEVASVLMVMAFIAYVVACLVVYLIRMLARKS